MSHIDYDLQFAQEVQPWNDQPTMDAYHRREEEDSVLSDEQQAQQLASPPPPTCDPVPVTQEVSSRKIRNIRRRRLLNSHRSIVTTSKKNIPKIKYSGKSQRDDASVPEDERTVGEVITKKENKRKSNKRYSVFPEDESKSHGESLLTDYYSEDDGSKESVDLFDIFERAFFNVANKMADKLIDICCYPKGFTKRKNAKSKSNGEGEDDETITFDEPQEEMGIELEAEQLRDNTSETKQDLARDIIARNRARKMVQEDLEDAPEDPLAYKPTPYRRSSSAF